MSEQRNDPTAEQVEATLTRVRDWDLDRIEARCLESGSDLARLTVEVVRELRRYRDLEANGRVLRLGVPREFNDATLAACARREVGQRQRVYGRAPRGPHGALSPAQVNEIAMMQEISAEYQARADAAAALLPPPPEQADLFGDDRED